jgi:hypothetical protein
MPFFGIQMIQFDMKLVQGNGDAKTYPCNTSNKANIDTNPGIDNFPLVHSTKVKLSP